MMDYIAAYVPPPENMQRKPTHRAANFWAERIERAACESVTWDRLEGCQIDWNEFHFAIKGTVMEALAWMYVPPVETANGQRETTDSSDAPTAPLTP